MLSGKPSGIKYYFRVLCMILLGIESWFPEPLANTLLTMPIVRVVFIEMNTIYKFLVFKTKIYILLYGLFGIK